MRVAFGLFFAHVAATHRGLDAHSEKALHRFACSGYPFLKKVPPGLFVKGMFASEVGVATALLVPVVPPVVGASALTAFGSGLMGVYAKTPGLRREHSVRPSDFGMAMAKDSWMVAAGSSVLIDAFLARRSRRNRSSPPAEVLVLPG